MKTALVILVVVLLFAGVLWWSQRTVTVSEGGVGVPRPLNPCGQGHSTPNPLVCIEYQKPDGKLVECAGQSLAF